MTIHPYIPMLVSLAIACFCTYFYVSQKHISKEWKIGLIVGMSIFYTISVLILLFSLKLFSWKPPTPGNRYEMAIRDYDLPEIRKLLEESSDFPDWKKETIYRDFYRELAKLPNDPLKTNTIIRLMFEHDEQLARFSFGAMLYRALHEIDVPQLTILLQYDDEEVLERFASNFHENVRTMLNASFTKPQQFDEAVALLTLLTSLRDTTTLDNMNGNTILHTFFVYLTERIWKIYSVFHGYDPSEALAKINKRAPLVLETLLRYTDDVNSTNNTGQTPLMLAVHFPDLAKILLDHGADLWNTVDSDGDNVMFYAVTHTSDEVYPEIMDVLFEHGGWALLNQDFWDRLRNYAEQNQDNLDDRIVDLKARLKKHQQYQDDMAELITDEMNNQIPLDVSKLVSGYLFSKKKTFSKIK